MKMTQAYKAQTDSDILDESVEVHRRRIDQLGTREPQVEPQGDDRIVLQVPGLSDASHLVALLGKTAKMRFQMVDASVGPGQEGHRADRRRASAARSSRTRTAADIVVRAPCDGGGSPPDQCAGRHDERPGEVDVVLNFDSVGAKQFGQATKENVGATSPSCSTIKIMEDARIREAVLAGSAENSGGFVLHSPTRSRGSCAPGALPAPLRSWSSARSAPNSVPTGSVPASFSTITGLVLVTIFMVLRYGLFGIFADVA